MEKPATAALTPPIQRLCLDERPGDVTMNFREVYEQHFDFVWRTIAGLMSGSSATTEDAVQDVWLTVSRRLSEFRGESHIRTWLFAIARNVAANHRRRARRKGGLQHFDETAPPPSAANPPTASAEAAWQEVQQFLATLSEPRRELFLCRFLLEMTAREVAESTGCSVVVVYAETRWLKASFKRWLQAREEQQ